MKSRSRIREIGGEPPVTLIAVTGWGQKADKDRAVASGFDHHFTKPVEPTVLSRLLAAVSVADIHRFLAKGDAPRCRLRRLRGMRHVSRCLSIALLFAPLAPSRRLARARRRDRTAWSSPPQQHATRIGVDVLRKGGNAIDAAVAVGYALAVIYPAAGNLGGGGFMTLQLADGRKTFIDFRETAPLAATADMFLDAQRQCDSRPEHARPSRRRGAGHGVRASNTRARNTARCRAPD